MIYILTLIYPLGLWYSYEYFKEHDWLDCVNWKYAYIYLPLTWVFKEIFKFYGKVKSWVRWKYNVSKNKII